VWNIPYRSVGVKGLRSLKYNPTTYFISAVNHTDALHVFRF